MNHPTLQLSPPLLPSLVFLQLSLPLTLINSKLYFVTTQTQNLSFQSFTVYRMVFGLLPELRTLPSLIVDYSGRLLKGESHRTFVRTQRDEEVKLGRFSPAFGSGLM